MDRDLGVTGEERTPGPQGQAGDKVLLVLLQKRGAAGQVEDRQTGSGLSDSSETRGGATPWKEVTA